MASLSQRIASEGWFWFGFGLTGGAIFQGRFYIQWIVSELRKRSVMPIAFWYMSSVGSVMLFVYSLVGQEPVGALGYSLNLIIYSRNLVHIWRERGHLSRRLNVGIHLVAGLVSAAAVGATVLAWIWEWQINSGKPPDQANREWFWLALGVAGNGLFACRFLIQWIATERAKKSVIPVSFWYFSLAACVILMAHFIHRQDWVLTLTQVASLPIYARNLWFIHRSSAPAADEEMG